MLPKKLRFKFHLILFLCLMGLLQEGLVFAQEGTAAQEQQQEQHDTKDLEQLLRRYNTDSEKVIDDTSKIHNTDTSTSEVSDKEIESMRPENSASGIIKNVRLKPKKEEEVSHGKSFSEDIRIPLAKFQKLSEEEILILLKENTKDSKWGPYLDNFPRLKLLSVRLIKDKDAIPSALKIIEDKDKLIWFGGIMISTFLWGFLLEKAMRKKGRLIIASIALYILRVVIMTGLRLAIIIYYYGDELRPAGKVFTQTFLSS